MPFFATPDDLRAWFAEHSADATELWVEFWKVGTGKPSVTWSQAVDQALCYGWIDGVRKSNGDESYRIRFTPRRPSSIWSAVNVAKVAELTERGLMMPAGLAAFAARREDRTGVYSFEARAKVAFDPEYETTFRADAKAWAFFESQPPGYRRTATHWVMSAKRPDTRQRRLATLMTHSGAGERLPQISGPASARGSRTPPR